jgi:hypothetical protein
LGGCSAVLSGQFEREERGRLRVVVSHPFRKERGMDGAPGMLFSPRSENPDLGTQLIAGS